MLCLSIVARRKLHSAQFMMGPPSFFMEVDPVPEIKEGIVVSQDSNTVWLSPERSVVVSDALLSSDPAAGHVKRNADGNLVLMRASYVELPDGTVQLVPEDSTNEVGALVFLDIGRGSHTSLRIAGDTPGILAKTSRPSDVLFGSEDVALMHLLPHWPVGAYRSSKRWVCFGADRVHEVVYLRFDGGKVSFDIMR